MDHSLHLAFGIKLLTQNFTVMSIVKVIEVIATSESGFEDATRNALKEASQTVKNIPDRMNISPTTDITR